MGAKRPKSLVSKICVESFLFLLNFENAQKNIMKSANFFLYCTKRRCSKLKPLTDKATIKS